MEASFLDENNGVANWVNLLSNASTIPVSFAAEDAKRAAEVDPILLVLSQPTGRDSLISSSPEPVASSFRFKPICAEFEGLYVVGMERGFLSQRGSRGGRGMKEKQQTSVNSAKDVVDSNKDGTKETAPNGKSLTSLLEDSIIGYATKIVEVVKDGMDSSFVDLKVMEGVDESVSNIPKSFASLVTNKAVTCKVNFRSLDLDKPINAKAEVRIPKASILDVHSRFGFSLHGYFVGKRVAFPTIENYVKNAWKKFGLVQMDANDGLSVMATKLDDEEVLHTVKVEYEWKPPRCGVCMVFGHDDMLCPKWHVEKPKKQHTNHDGFQHTSSSHGTNVGSKVQFKPKKLIWQAVSKKNSASSSGTKKNSEVSRKVTSSNNPFDALNTIEEGDELGSNGGSSNSGNKVVQDVAGSTASGSPSNTPLVTRINELKSQMIEGTLVDDLVNEDNDSEVEEVYDETATYMASTSFNVNKASKRGNGGGNKSLYEQWKENHGEDPYDDDDFDDPGLTDAQMKFANAFDINLHGQLR
ncbi:hypothetical protein Tco_0335502 [Tanacetum coccineum]